MSEIKKLIERLCPDGVEYKRLGDITEILRGKRLTKKELTDNAEYPVYHGGIEPIGYYSHHNRPANTVMIINVGASAGTVGYCNKPFWSSDGCYCIDKSELLSDRYLYYVLSKNQLAFVSKVRHAGIPTLDSKVIANFDIPVPPIEVQNKIVEILDNFTELEAELEAKLEAELEARRKQYEYYRNQLLTFDKVGGARFDVKWMKIMDVCSSICSGGTPSTSNRSYYEGNIPWLRTQEVDWTEIYDTSIKISQEALDNSSAKMIPANCVIVAMYGATAAKVAINRIPLCTNQACCNLEINENVVLIKYVYQWLCKEYEKLKSLGEGSQHNINAQKVKKYPIPIPPMEEQKRIVSILDRFEALTTDLQSGLPAEIEARRKQYEYYREKLLTFKRKSA